MTDNKIIPNNILKPFDVDIRTLTPPLLPIYPPCYVVLVTLFEMMK